MHSWTYIYIIQHIQQSLTIIAPLPPPIIIKHTSHTHHKHTHTTYIYHRQQTGSSMLSFFQQRIRLVPCHRSILSTARRTLSTTTAAETSTTTSTSPPTTTTITAPSSSSLSSSSSSVNPRLDALNRAYATGRRKTSVARVWIKQGEGRIVVNDKDVHEYFGRVAYRDKLVEPFAVTGTAGQFDVWCTVKGGGTTGQVGAVALGISRALEVWDPNHRPALAKESLFTRDSRAVERKLPGQPKARKSDQWVKR